MISADLNSVELGLVWFFSNCTMQIFLTHYAIENLNSVNLLRTCIVWFWNIFWILYLTIQGLTVPHFTLKIKIWIWLIICTDVLPGCVESSSITERSSSSMLNVFPPITSFLRWRSWARWPAFRAWSAINSLLAGLKTLRAAARNALAPLRPAALSANVKKR